MAPALAAAGPLKHQTTLFVIGNLEKFPQSSLSLLPISVRMDILLAIPIIDVQKLTTTPFMKDIDLNVIWKRLYETRIPKNMQMALTDVLKRPEIDRACLDLSWKEKFLLCCFDAATASKFYRQSANCVMYLFEMIMFFVNKNDYRSYSYLPNNFQSPTFNVRISGKMVASHLSTPFVSRISNDDLYSSLLSPMPPQAQSQPNTAQSIESFVNIVEVMKFLQNFFQFHPRILLLHNVTILDITQNVLWPTAHISGFATPNATSVLTNFLQDVQLVCMRSRGWNPAKNLSILRTIFQVMIFNRKRMLTGIVLDLLNIGVPAQNQVLAMVSSTLTGLLIIPHRQMHIRAPGHSPYNCLTIFSIHLSMESAEEMKHITAIIRSQMQLEFARIDCNHKSLLFEPRPFEADVYSSLFESATMQVFTNPALQKLEIRQVMVPCSVFQNLLFHFLTSTSTSEQQLSLSCLGISQSPLKSRIPVCKSEGASDAGRHGSRSLRLHMCHFPPEVFEWLCLFPKIRLKSLEIIATEVTDNLSALVTLSKLTNLEIVHMTLSVVSVQHLWIPLTALLSAKQSELKVKVTASLIVRNVSKEYAPHLLDILVKSARVFLKLHIGLGSSTVQDIDLFQSLLEVVFGLPYLSDLSLVLVCPALRSDNVNHIVRIWERISNRTRFKSLSIIGDSTLYSSNLTEPLKDALHSMAWHYCHPDACGCLNAKSI